MPTIQKLIAANGDDGSVLFNDGGGAFVYRADLVRGGYATSTDHRETSWLRYTSLPIRQGAIIQSATLTFRARGGIATVVRTKIHAHDVDESIAPPIDVAQFLAQYAARTTAVVTWNNIPPWTGGIDYVSPDISPVLQEVIDRPGWNPGNSVQFFWGDFDDLSDNLALRNREATDYTQSVTNPTILDVTYTGSDQVMIFS